MFGFVKQIFISARCFFGCDLLNVNSLKCVSMNNQECKVIPKIVNINGDEPVLFSVSVKTSGSSGSCNNISDPYANCLLLMIKSLNVRVFDLPSRNNEKRHIEWCETCKCKSRLDGSVCNNTQR